MQLEGKSNGKFTHTQNNTKDKTSTDKVKNNTSNKNKWIICARAKQHPIASALSDICTRCKKIIQHNKCKIPTKCTHKQSKFVRFTMYAMTICTRKIGGNNAENKYVEKSEYTKAYAKKEKNTENCAKKNISTNEENANIFCSYFYELAHAYVKQYLIVQSHISCAEHAALQNWTPSILSVPFEFSFISKYYFKTSILKFASSLNYNTFELITINLFFLFKMLILTLDDASN